MANGQWPTAIRHSAFGIRHMMKIRLSFAGEDKLPSANGATSYQPRARERSEQPPRLRKNEKMALNPPQKLKNIKTQQKINCL
jgi:hypothetical protein